jgi:hypothetical protein
MCNISFPSALKFENLNRDHYLFDFFFSFFFLKYFLFLIQNGYAHKRKILINMHLVNLFSHVFLVIMLNCYYFVFRGLVFWWVVLCMFDLFIFLASTLLRLLFYLFNLGLGFLNLLTAFPGEEARLASFTKFNIFEY